MVPLSHWAGRIAALLWFLGGAAHAGSLEVTPVRIDLSTAQRVVAVTVRNAGDRPSVIQLLPQTWSQRDNADVLAATNDLLATPPIFTLAPGAEQIVRVGLRTPSTARAEQTYRLIFEEVPPPPDPGSKGLRMALRISVPVFVASTTPARGELTWSASRVNGKLAITAANAGTAHLRLTGLTFTAADANAPARFGDAATYLLPQSQHTWLIGAAVPPGAHLHVAGHDDAQAIHADLAAP
jgi:fimbrial chaperone protein